MYAELSGVSCSALSTIGVPSDVTIPPAVNGSLLTLYGKPEILYIGAEWCPNCAAERWSLIVALSKFGVFSNLTYMMSSSSDSPSDIATFSFYGANYTSPYISFVAVEMEDRSYDTLQTLTTDEQALYTQYDPTGWIPFVDLANQFVLATGPQYSSSVLSGATWNQVASQLSNSSNSYAINIDGAANALIREICSIDGGNPSVICDLSSAQSASPSLSPFFSLVYSAITENSLETILCVTAIVAFSSTILNVQRIRRRISVHHTI